VSPRAVIRFRVTARSVAASNQPPAVSRVLSLRDRPAAGSARCDRRRKERSGV